jgi:LAS superfamily LD-carboxypeptidase LdcB
MDARTANSDAPAPLGALELTGRARTHVQEYPELGCALHPAAAAALLRLRAAAAAVGIDLQPVSGFRDFQRQLAIWNGKFRGERPLQGRDGRPLEAATLSEAERVAAILVWSALPGASRHHWGSDCDVIDRAMLPPGTPVTLESADYAADGRYARLSAWLARHAHDYGFYRPYDLDRGGVLPEPWHLSYAPIADAALAAMSPALLGEALAAADLAGREAVTARLPELYARYVAAVATPPAAALAKTTLSRAARPA